MGSIVNVTVSRPPLRAMTPALAQMTPVEFHSQAIRWERARERVFLALGNTEQASAAAYHARRHQRELDSLLFS
jgi:hypothetical protein